MSFASIQCRDFSSLSLLQANYAGRGPVPIVLSVMLRIAIPRSDTEHYFFAVCSDRLIRLKMRAAATAAAKFAAR